MPDVTELGLDTKDAVQNVLELSNVLGGYVKVLGSVSGVSSKFNADGSSQSHTITQITKDFNKLVTTLSNVDGAYVVTAASVQKFNNTFGASNKLRSDIFDANRMKESAAAVEVVIAGLSRSLQGKDVARAYVQELAKFDRAIKATAEGAIKAGVSVQQVEALFAKFQAGGKSSDFSGTERTIVQGFERARQAAAAFGTTASDASNRLASTEAQRVRNVQRVQAELLKVREIQAQNDRQAAAAAARATAGGVVRAGFALRGLDTASAGEMTAYRTAVNAVVNEFTKGNLSLQQFGALVTKVNSGSREFATSELGLVRALQAVGDAEGQLGAAARKAGDDAVAAAKRQAEAQLALRAELQRSRAAYASQKAASDASGRNAGAGAAVGSALTGAFGGNLFKASAAEAERFHVAVNKVATDIAKLKFSPGQLQDVFTRAAAGATQFTGVEADIYQKYLAITRAVNTFGTSSKTAGDSAAVAARRAAEAQVALTQALDKSRQKAIASGAAQSAAARAQADAGALKAALSAAFAPAAGVTASTAELKRLDGAINQITNDVKSGRVAADAYYAVLVKMATGATTFSVEETALVNKLRGVQIASEAAGSAAEAAANRAAAAQAKNKREIDAAVASLERQKQAALKQNAAAATASTNAQAATSAYAAAATAFGKDLTGKSTALLLAYNNAIRLSVDLLARGKVTSTQFNDALARVSAGLPPLTSLSGAVSTLQTRLHGARKALDETGDAGEKAGKKVFLSWQAVVRIFESQVIFAAFSKLQNAFTSSLGEAATYSKQIALIQTISQDAGLSSEQWARSIRRVSDELGNPIADTAAAAYDLLSNQVTRGADTITTLRTAIEFGRTTNANAADSVNLLSSAINTFGLKASDAESVAARFFTVVDLGRVKVPEIANNFARAGSLAEALGVSLDETGAALSSLTRRGIKSNEAFTLMNNVFLKLIKPTESLEARIKSWGFESGQAAIEALGFVGVLERLSDAYQGSTAAAAKDFDELRGARGIISLTGQGLTEFKKDLAEIAQSGDKYKIAKGIVSESDGQKLQNEFNRIKTFFINEVGGSLLRTVVGFARAIETVTGNLHGIYEGAKVVATGLAAAFLITKINSYGVAAIALIDGMAAAMGLLTVAEVEAAAAASALFAPFALGTAIVVGIGVAYVNVMNSLAGRSHEAFEEVAAENQAAADKIVAATEEWANKSLAITQGTLDKARQAFLQYASDVRVTYETMGDALREEGTKIASDLASTFNVIKGIISQRVSQLENQARHASDEVKKANESIANVKNEDSKDRFDILVKAAKAAGNLNEELRLVNGRISQLAREGAEAFKAGDRAKGASLFDQARRVAAQAASERVQRPIYETRYRQGKPQTAPFDERDARGKPLKVRPQIAYQARTGTRSEARFDGGQFSQAQVDLGKQLIALEKEYAEQQARIAAESAAQAAVEAKNFEDLKDKFKALEDFSIRNKKGEVKPEYEGDEGRAKAAQDYAKAQEEALAALKKSGAPITQQQAQFLAFQQQYAAFVKQLNAQAENIKRQLDNAAELEKITKAAEAISKAYDEAKAAVGRVNAEVARGTKAIEDQKAEMKTLLSALEAGIKGAAFETDKGTAGALFGTSRARDAALALVKQLGPAFEQAGTEAGDRAIKALITQIDAKLAQSSTLFSGPLRDAMAVADKDGKIAKSIDDILFEMRRKLTEFEKTRINLSVDTASLGRAQAHVDALAARMAEVPGLFKGFGPAADAAARGIAEGLRPAEAELKVLIGLTGDAINALNDFQRARAAADAAGGGGVVEGKARGGLIGYFAGGGFMDDFMSGKYASGTDRVPVMATRGEYMVNADATRQFLPLLRAINAGKLSGGGGGGSTTTVGDINVSVHGGSSSAATVKGIANGISRGLRTGAIRLTP